MFRTRTAAFIRCCGAWLAVLALGASRPAALPTPPLTGFTPVFTAAAADLRKVMEDGNATVVGSSLRVPVNSQSLSTPTITLSQELRGVWARLAPEREVLLEVEFRGVKPGPAASVNLRWSERAPYTGRALQLVTGQAGKWEMNNPFRQDHTGRLPAAPPATPPALHRLGLLLRDEKIWAVVDNRLVGSYNEAFDPGSALATDQLTMELGGAAGQTVELTRVRVLAGPRHSAATLAHLEQVRQQNAPAIVRRQQAAAALAGPATRPPDLTPLAELRGTALFAALSKFDGAAAYINQTAEQVTLKGTFFWENGAGVRLPEAFEQAYRARLGQQPLYLELRGQLLNDNDYDSPGGAISLQLAAAQPADNVSCGWSADREEWFLSARKTTSDGPATAATASQPHTVGLLLAGDSATAYFEDRRMPGRLFTASLAARPDSTAPLSMRMVLQPGQILRVEFIRLSAQGEAQAIVARELATRERAARELAARETAARELAARELAARETAARELAARETAARETAARETAARELVAREAAVRTQERETAARQEAARSTPPSPAYTSGGVQHSTAPSSIFNNSPAAKQRESRANEPRVTWLYARTYETMLTFSNNTAYQIVYAYVTAPESATQSEVQSAIPDDAIRAGFGMRAIGSTINKCDRGNCEAALRQYAGTYRNVSTRSAGQFRVQ